MGLSVPYCCSNSISSENTCKDDMPIRQIEAGQCTVKQIETEQDEAQKTMFKIPSSLARMYLPAYLINPSPTAILHSNKTENQERNRKRREELDIERKLRWAAGEDRARMRYRMNTHPKGI